MSSFLKTSRAGIRQMLPFHLAVLAYSGFVALAALAYDAPALAYAPYIKAMAPIYLVILPGVLWLAKRVHAALPHGNGRTVQAPGERRSERLGRHAAGLVTLGMFVLFMGSFTTFKSLMPAIMGGFPYDRTLADLDQLLHGNADPGPLLLSAVGTPAVMALIEWHYGTVWTVLAFVPAFFIALFPVGAAFRLRYFLTVFLVWTILGSLLACLFLSAGPVFHGEATGDHGRFAAYLAALAEHAGSAPSSTIRAYLWQAHLAGTAGFGTGISAFPSVHVGVAAMNALFLLDHGRKAGLAGLAHLVAIMVSSVLLGWHYAVDGYVSVFVALCVHAGLKRLLADDAGAPLTPSPSPAIP